MKDLARAERKFDHSHVRSVYLRFFHTSFRSHHVQRTRLIGCVIVLTGVTDWISDGNTVVKLSNGHSLLGEITGSGCMVGTSVATFCAGISMAAASDFNADFGRLTRGDMLVGAVGGYVALYFWLFQVIIVS